MRNRIVESEAGEEVKGPTTPARETGSIVVKRAFWGPRET